MTTIAKKVAEAKALLEAVGEGEWSARRTNLDTHVTLRGPGGVDHTFPAWPGRLVVAAVTNLPAMLAVVEAAQALREASCECGDSQETEIAFSALDKALAALEADT